MDTAGCIYICNYYGKKALLIGEGVGGHSGGFGEGNVGVGGRKGKRGSNAIIF